MPDNLAISRFLSEVLQDWRESRAAFPANTYSNSHCPPWPIPFFGNPATAMAATVGVNPAAGEFRCGRSWNAVQTPADWKRRLKNYFNLPTTPAHEWFEAWRVGLTELGLGYEEGTAAHFDVSYRPTKAMIKNKTIDTGEFRCMVERDVARFFCLLRLCPKLRLLLVFGPIIRADGSKESLAHFLQNQAPHHGFTVSPNGECSLFRHLDTGKAIYFHEVSTPGEKCITCRVVKNLNLHHHALRRRLQE